MVKKGYHAILFLLISLACVPGCFWQRDNASKKTARTKPIFADDVDGFTLKDDKNVFSAPLEDDEQIALDSDFVEDAWAERKGANREGLQTIYFDYDRSGIRPDQEATLRQNVDTVKKLTNEGSTVVVEGHACRYGGSAIYNMQKSEERARTVASRLRKEGVSPSKIKTVGRGYELPQVPEGDKEAQAPNRRTELYVLDSKAA